MPCRWSPLRNQEDSPAERSSEREQDSARGHDLVSNESSQVCRASPVDARDADHRFSSIVRYHTSWVEADEHSQEIDTDAESTQPTETTQTTSDPSQASTPSDSASDFDEEDTDEYDGGDLDIDLGLDELNMDFLSVGHSKSISYPSIHFGNEDDASVANTPVESRNATRASSPIIPGRQSPLKRVRTLYIQVSTLLRLSWTDAETCRRWNTSRSSR